MIRSSSNVALATFTGHKMEGHSAIFLFRILERLSGALPVEFEIRVDHYPPEALEPGFAVDKTFGDHRDYRFWNNYDIARADYSGDCKVKPTFEIGEDYLVFADSPYSIRNFEKIEKPDDLWLSVVRRTIADARRPGQAVLTLETFVMQFDTIYLAKCPQRGGPTPYIIVLETFRGPKERRFREVK